MIQIRHFFLIVFLILEVVRGYGQLTADGATVAETNYTVTSPQDPVFCFPTGTSMVLKYENGGEGDLYTWYRHNTGANTWDNQLAAGTNQILVNSPGGYRLVVENSSGNIIADQRCWVYNIQKITNVKENIEYDDCFGVELSAKADTVPLICYDPADGSAGGVHYNLVFNWTTNPDGDEQHSGKRVAFNAPYADLAYVVSVVDRFGNSVTASVDYTSIAVLADFETEILKDTVLNERHSEAEGSAPIEIRFTDTSLGKVNGWQWIFGNAGRSVEPDPMFVFSEAGTDSVTLRVVNRASGCEDLSDPFIVTVKESELEIPNVFTPNGDGINDEFRVVYKSLKKFKMVIFNRWGRKVYEGSDPSRGWNGKVGGKTGAPGVYFYYVHAEGYNKGEVYNEKGSVNLIRSK
jgi:gliding motility-associated-like protein